MQADDPGELARMRSWLALVASELEIEPDLVTDLETPLLGLISAVAHGPSRPGAPLTAFLVGVAAGRGGNLEALIPRISALAAARRADD